MNEQLVPCSSQVHEHGQRIRLSVGCKLLPLKNFEKRAGMPSLELSQTDTNRLMGGVREFFEDGSIASYRADSAWPASSFGPDRSGML